MKLPLWRTYFTYSSRPVVSAFGTLSQSVSSRHQHAKRTVPSRPQEVLSLRKIHGGQHSDHLRIQRHACSRTGVADPATLLDVSDENGNRAGKRQSVPAEAGWPFLVAARHACIVISLRSLPTLHSQAHSKCAKQMPTAGLGYITPMDTPPGHEERLWWAHHDASEPACSDHPTGVHSDVPCRTLALC